MITLRAYNHEIESLIDRSQFDEAIAHCTAILIKFPKNINAYRNLGKALLESKKYTEASDIFRRVLSVFPDDFISHVGLSIIKEDERNLDLAIWHMEQAFDVQPSNLAIQEELKRLFGRRDGASPQKIRLTRGALVRMYARGELYQQAIAEILATLPEDPQRIDLQVILGRMYYLSGNLLDAAETCNQIIEKLPYCFEANKILEQIFTKNGNLENAKIYREHLSELEPYYQFSDDPDEVSDDLIQLEKVSYIPVFSKQSPLPDWAHAVGITWEENTPNQNQDWLNELGSSEKEQFTDLNGAEGVPSEEYNQHNDFDDQGAKSSSVEPVIPDWMKEAGWEPSTGDFEIKENEIAQNLNIRSDNNKEELPLWLIESEKTDLQDFAQTDSSKILDNENNIELPISEETDSKIDNVKHAVDDWTQEVDMENNNPDAAPNNDPSNSDQDWLKDLSSIPEEGKLNEKSDQDLPDWLKNFEQDQLENEEKDSDMPEWLRNLQTANANHPETANEEIDSSIQSGEQEEVAVPPVIIEETSGSSITELVETDPEANLETRILQPVENIEPGQEETDVTLPQPLIGLPEDWQKEIESTEPPSVENAQEPELGEVPEWVRSIISEKKNEEESQPQIIENVNDNSIPSSNSHPESATIEGPEIENLGAISGKTSDELLEWLRDLQPADDIPDQENEPIESNLLPEEDTIDEANPVLNRLNQISESKSVPEIVSEQNDSTKPVTNTSEQIVEKINEPDISYSDTHPAVDNISTPVNTEFVQTDEVSDEPIHQEKGDELSQNESFDFDQLVKLIESDHFSEIPTYVDGMVTSGSNFLDLLSLFNTYQKSKNNDFLYWQCLGDLNARQDRFAESLAAYEKAEVILTNNIK